MKAFTDSNLERFKSTVADIEDVWRRRVSQESLRLNALLHRLEAAEKALELSACPHDFDEHEESPCDYSAAMINWQEAKGVKRL